jgi:hypothetical protein
MSHILQIFCCSNRIAVESGDSRAALRFRGKAEPPKSETRHGHNVELTSVTSVLLRLMR